MPSQVLRGGGNNPGPKGDKGDWNDVLFLMILLLTKIFGV